MFTRREFLKIASTMPVVSGLGVGKELAETDLRRQCLAGLRHNQDDLFDKDILNRLNHELDVIHRRGLAEGFLFLAALLRQCQAEGIVTYVQGPVNGSLVTYALGIHRFNPLRHRLLFERFIDPERYWDLYVQVNVTPHPEAQVMRILGRFPDIAIRKVDDRLNCRWGPGQWGTNDGLEVAIVKNPALHFRAALLGKRGVHNLDNLPEDDARTLGLFRRGETEGLYRFDQEAMQQYVGILKPQHFGDLIAAVAFYSLMPLENGITKSDLEREWCPGLAAFGIRSMGPHIIYQEDIMRLFRGVGGMQLSDGMKYIRAVAHGKAEEAAGLLEQFRAGARRQGTEKVAERIAEALVQYWCPTYCKAWAVSTAYLAYQTAFLKAHFPKEFERARRAVEWDTDEEIVASLV